MEGPLLKQEGFLSRWNKYYFVIHKGLLLQYDKLNGKMTNSINLKQSTVAIVSADPLVFTLSNGAN